MMTRLVLHFVYIITITEVILLATYPDLLKVEQEMGMKELSSHCIFVSCRILHVIDRR